MKNLEAEVRLGLRKHIGLWLALGLHLASSSYTAQLPRDGTFHRGLGLPASVSN